MTTINELAQRMRDAEFRGDRQRAADLFRQIQALRHQVVPRMDDRKPWSQAQAAQVIRRSAQERRAFKREYRSRQDCDCGECRMARKIDALLAGQPAPVKPVVDDAMVERAWNAYVECEMDEPKSMRAALVAALEGRT